jgi:prefoldin alpha subunit
MATEIDREAIQGMVLKLRLLQVQAESYTQQLAAIQASFGEYEKAITTLTAVENIEEGSELLVSVGAGAAIYATLARKDKVIIGLGGGVSAEKSVKEALKILKNRQESLSESQKKLTEVLGKVETEAQKIEQSLQAISVQMEKKG